MTIKERTKNMAIDEMIDITIYQVNFKGVFGRNRSEKFELVQSLESLQDALEKFKAIKPKTGRGAYYSKKGELTKRNGYEAISQPIYGDNGDKVSFIVENGVIS